MPAPTDSPATRRWAPWWHYVIVLAALNAGVGPIALADLDQVPSIVVRLLLNVVAIVVVTAVWRRRHRTDR